MTDPKGRGKTCEPDVKAIVERYEPNHYKHSPASMVRHEDGDYVRYSDHAALISKLTAERDDLRTTTKLLLGWKDRAEAAEKERDTSAREWREAFDGMHKRAMDAEKRVKELEAERDALCSELAWKGGREP